MSDTFRSKPNLKLRNVKKNDLKGEFTNFLKFNTTLGHIYTLHFTIKTPSDWFRMAVMAQNVVLFCTLLSLHKEKTLTTNIK